MADELVEQDALPICPEPGCGESFTTHRGLASHMKKHARPVECPYCNREVRYLGPHLIKDHPEQGKDDQLVEGVRELVNENVRLRARIAELEAANS